MSQSAHEFAPDVAWTVPAGQLTQLVEPIIDVYCPITQAIQTADDAPPLVADEVPAEHIVHMEEPKLAA
jgi:hypothetical protein